MSDTEQEPQEVETTEEVEETTDEVRDPAALLKAYEAEKAKRRELAQKLREQEASQPEPDPVDADAIKAQAEKEANARVAERIVRTEMKAAAKGRIADPNDALLFIDLKQFDVADDGSVNETDLNDAIEELLKQKPYLAAQSRRFQDSADGGSRNDSAKREPTLNDLFRSVAGKK